MRCILTSLLLAMIGLVAPATQPALDDKCRETLENWRAKFDAERLSYLVAPPFVVAGDGGIDRLRRYESHTIRAATDALQNELFDAKPTEPIVVLLLESETPYRRLAKEWLGDENISPFGYFRRDGVMVMNVGTGTGTLVHELTHALIKPDFPDVPDWFNEGLGSLFEQCSINDNQIRGLVNWRLPALQRAIRRDKLRSLSELIDDPHFYGDAHVGLNYAQARYLLLYLQQQKILTGFYRSLRANHATDPTGLETLKQTITPQSLEQFEKDWREWVLTLRFPA